MSDIVAIDTWGLLGIRLQYLQKMRTPDSWFFIGDICKSERWGIFDEQPLL